MYKVPLQLFLKHWRTLFLCYTVYKTQYIGNAKQILQNYVAPHVGDTH